jgi:hypothetical protein
MNDKVMPAGWLDAVPNVSVIEPPASRRPSNNSAPNSYKREVSVLYESEQCVP